MIIIVYNMYIPINKKYSNKNSNIKAKPIAPKSKAYS